MNGLTRAGATLFAVAAAGVLLYIAAQFDRGTTGGYWAAYGVVAGAGLLLAAAQVRGRAGHPPAALGINFLPVLIAAGWVLLAMQPHGNWFRHHVLAWSGDIGIRDVVRDLATWLGVLAFGIGYTFGLILEPRPRRIVEPATAEPDAEPVYDRTATDEPTTAERRELADRDGAAEPVRSRPAR